MANVCLPIARSIAVAVNNRQSTERFSSIVMHPKGRQPTKTRKTLETEPSDVYENVVTNICATSISRTRLFAGFKTRRSPRELPWQISTRNLSKHSSEHPDQQKKWQSQRAREWHNR